MEEEGEGGLPKTMNIRSF